MKKEKPRHIEGQCTSTCRRVGCPEEETTEREMTEGEKELAKGLDDFFEKE